jgi:Enolase C-terminal domain-like
VRQLEESFDLTWIEEPVRRWDVRGHASLRQHVRAAVASGPGRPGTLQRWLTATTSECSAKHTVIYEAIARGGDSTGSAGTD